MTKGELVKINAAAREARMWAGEQVKAAAYCAAEDDVEGYSRCMAECARLIMISAKLIKKANAAVAEMKAA